MIYDDALLLLEYSHQYLPNIMGQPDSVTGSLPIASVCLGVLGVL